MKKFSKKALIYIVVVVSIFFNLLQIFLPETSPAQFKDADSEFEKRFEYAKEDLSTVLENEHLTADYSHLIRQLEICTIYGTYCDSKSVMDPMWRSIISKLRELDNEEIYATLTQSDRTIIATFLRDFHYSNSPALAETNIEVVFSIVDQALALYFKT